MNKSKIMKGSLISLLKDYPESFVDDILNDEDFISKTGIKFNYNINLSEADIQFEDELFYSSLITLYKDGHANVKDESDKVWDLSLSDEPEDAPIKDVLLSSGDSKFTASEFWFIHPDINLRLAYFEYIKTGLLLGKASAKEMVSTLSSNIPASERMTHVKTIIGTSPGVFYSNLSSSLMKRSLLRLDQLVPESLSYYQSLIGEIVDSHNIIEYFNMEGFEHVKYLIDLYGEKSVPNILSLNWNPNFSNEKIISLFDDNLLCSTYEYIKSNNCFFLDFSFSDVLIKIRHADDDSVNIISRIVDTLRNVDVKNTLSLLSFFFILTDAVLIRSKLFDCYPVFYRRLASLSHASLLYRCFCANSVEEDQKLCDWIARNFGQDFYIGNLLDLRTDSGWLPDYAEPTQLRYELFGRLLNSISVIDEAERHKYVKADDEFLSNLPFSIDMFLPGPLEGGMEPTDMPSYIEEIINNGLASSGSTTDSFTAFMNSSRYWKLDKQYLASVAEKIRSSGYMFEKIESIDVLYSCLNGLAVAASITKSELLADELLILTRVYRREFLKERKLQELVFIGVLASGSFSSITSWCKYLGQYLSELTYLDLEYEEQQNLYYLIEAICNVEPRLFTTISKAYVLLEEQCR
ncbi:hypothetical protein WR37_10850 [Vibrio parahaemolyticus]|uniref:hypothetical protein n=1 Tax=Vibrio parahaemolyticus TaxID=670 RepID=UPI00061AF13B|nr:hypothetical protein [Vibrio parahaemolyticus]KKC95302.1 hypothetical protein WR37_10850 [Vibrio parahaemolyticus]KKX72287.1 hypothetical protein UF34_02875 [Vibrio parahaemolyticus]